jgi:cytochrome P450
LQRGNAATQSLERLWLGPKPVYLVVDPELIKPLLKLGETDAGKGRLIRKLSPIIGMSSLLLHGEEHRRRRAILHEHLARGNVERYLPQMAAEIRAVGARLATTGHFNPHEATAALALRIISIGVFGRQVLSGGDEQALIAAVNAVEDDVADEMFRALPVGPMTWLKRRRRRSFAKLAMSLVVERLRKGAAETSALKQLEELGLSANDLRDEILTLLLAGHHTTGSTAAWVLYHLAAEPGLMDRLADEANRATDQNGEISAAGLKYASESLAVVREVLRLYPAAWWFSREVNRDLTFANFSLKRGTSLIISPWQLHRDPRHWDEPDQFRLSRSYTGAAYLPFGAGPRACVGMGVAMLELQLLALEIAAAYRFGTVSPFPAPWPKPSVTLIPPEISIQIGLRKTVVAQRPAA